MIREKKSLMEKITRLGPTEHEEIFKIFQKHQINFTENKNGIFVNLKNINDDIVKEINNFVDYCFENKPDLDEYDQKINECKYRNNINNMLQRSSSTILHSSIREPITKKDRMKELFEEVDKTEIVKDFIEKIHSNVDKVIHKKTGTKYIMARKRYMKKNTFDLDLTDELVPEIYDNDI
jgi:hypothetical protein